MEEILHNAFDKIHADDEMKKRTICFLSYKMKEMEERRNIVLCITVFLKIVMGAAIIAIVLYMFYLGF